MFSILQLFMIIPSLIVFAVTQSVKYNKHKYSKKKMALLYGGVILLAAVISVIYVLLTPSYVIEVVPKILLCVLGFIIVITSATLISRTPAYTEKLNKIIGFREFILTAEKDKLETMLEGNPDFYYNILPYAIVLGVSSVWEQKFAALTFGPPAWATGYSRDGVFDFIVFNAMFNRVNSRMYSAMTSRPAPSSASGSSFSGGGGHGGSFGGFSGGGHGGGGFRGR